MRAAEERKLVTVLFAALVGSTAYAGDRDPERVRAQLERFYGAMKEQIELTGGTVEKFAGDAVMAVFGAPIALEGHAERALHAALAMQRRLDELFGGELAMRIGVNTGEVVVGSPREGSSFVTGDAVNVADRLQKGAEPGEVLAGERTSAAVAGAFELGSARHVEAKGKPGGLTAVPVLRVLEETRPRGVSGLPRVFVGRDHELELLRATYRRAGASEEPHLITIVGEPGIGKSRLLGELEEALASEDPPPVWRTGRCLAYGDGITYWPVGEVLKEHYRIREGDSPDEAIQLLGGREILGLALGLDIAGDLHPLEAREQLHHAFVAFVEGLAAERPAVVLIEDIHWAEPELLDLLERVVAEARAAVLVVATARPEIFDPRPTWGAGWRNTSVLRLDPLPEADAARLLDSMLPSVLPDRLHELVVDRADGNPFFLEELVGELVDVGVLRRTNGAWTVADDHAGLAIPDTVYAALAARIDRLPPLEKSALQAGSVVGRVFWTAPVLHLVGGEEPDFVRAVHWLRRAGELARRRAELDESVELLTRAVELSDDPHERALLWREVGLGHALRFDGDAFWSAMEKALEGPLGDEERAEVYSLLAFQTSNRSGMWGVQTVPELVNAWVDRALELAAADSDARVRALIARANIEPEGHAEEAELAGALADASGDLELRSFALQVRASVAQDGGRYAEAESLAEQRLALVPEIDDPDHLLDVYEASCPAFCMVGRIDEAREFATLHEKAASPLSPHHRVHSFALLCEVEDAAGGWETVAARTDDIVAAVEGNLETPCTRNARSLLVAAVAQLATGREARALEARALELAQRGWSADALASPGIRLGLLRGDRDEIERWLEADVFRMYVYGPGVMSARLDALAAIRETAQVEEVAPRYAQQGLLLEPFALRALGIVRGDDELLARADERFSACGLAWHRSQTERLVAGL